MIIEADGGLLTCCFYHIPRFCFRPFTLFSISGSDYIHAKQVREKDKLKANETKKRLRDLAVIMGIKKDFIKELVKTGASVFDMVCNVFISICVFISFFPSLTEKELKTLLKHSRYTSEGRDDVLQTLSMHGQQIQAQVYSSIQHMKKQRAELQSRLKQIEESSNDSQTTNLVGSTNKYMLLNRFCTNYMFSMFFSDILQLVSKINLINVMYLK